MGCRVGTPEHFICIIFSTPSNVVSTPTKRWLATALHWTVPFFKTLVLRLSGTRSLVEWDSNYSLSLLHSKCNIILATLNFGVSVNVMILDPVILAFLLPTTLKCYCIEIFTTRYFRELVRLAKFAKKTGFTVLFKDYNSLFLLTLLFMSLL